MRARPVRTAGAALLLALAGVTLNTGTAGAAANPYTPEQVCGSGYTVVKSAPVGTDGTTYLLYNSSTTTSCVVTMKSASVGTASAVSAYVEPKGGTRVTDSGSFAYYAGPVRAKATSGCVLWGGSGRTVAVAFNYSDCP